MKTFTVALTLVVLALAIHDACARPRGRGAGGRIARPPPGDQGRGDQGVRRPGGQRGDWDRRHKHGLGPCLIVNTTANNEVLCDNRQSCPAFTECVQPPTDRKPPMLESLQVHFCIPKVCDPAVTDSCPTGTSCVQRKSEYRCLPDRRRQDSSEESAEDDTEDLEDANEDSENCRAVLRSILRPESGGRPVRPSGPCKVVNTTDNNAVLCDNSDSCPDFTECTQPPVTVRPPRVEGLEIHVCIPKACNQDDATSCPSGSTCRQLGEEFRCLPSRPRPGRRQESSESDEEEDDLLDDVEEENSESNNCRAVLRQAIGERLGGDRHDGPAGNRPAGAPRRPGGSRPSGEPQRPFRPFGNQQDSSEEEDDSSEEDVMEGNPSEAQRPQRPERFESFRPASRPSWGRPVRQGSWRPGR